jgi:hypothetical protein
MLHIQQNLSYTINYVQSEHYLFTTTEKSYIAWILPKYFLDI